ncbi:MAG: hypothetical protein BMS9Abin10_0809 [Gammaproteobacteria bacterium]|nr:MAG: hypothetical protein BMS9Abin10_0809 [Gammaproteobacteria bacterium]
MTSVKTITISKNNMLLLFLAVDVGVDSPPRGETIAGFARHAYRRGGTPRWPRVATAARVRECCRPVANARAIFRVYTYLSGLPAGGVLEFLRACEAGRARLVAATSR